MAYRSIGWHGSGVVLVASGLGGPGVISFAGRLPGSVIVLGIRDAARAVFAGEGRMAPVLT